MKIAMTGASGFIGQRLLKRLAAENAQVVTLGRRAVPGVESVGWDASRVPEPSVFDGVDAVVHLAGEPVSQRWSAEVKRRIYESRINGTRNLVQGLARAGNRPRTLIAASAIGYYGNRGEEVLRESSAPGNDFLAQTCIEWEAESRRAEELGMRVVSLRVGIVLGLEGGALATMLPPFRAGVGGPIGSGKQWVSWIHIDDMANLLLWSLHNGQVTGPVNATAPEPIRNSDFAKELGSAIGRPSLVPVPAFGLKLMYGEMANVVLASQRVIPEVAIRSGHTFRYPDLRSAFRQLLT